jgi:hypothetical protein
VYEPTTVLSGRVLAADGSANGALVVGCGGAAATDETGAFEFEAVAEPCVLVATWGPSGVDGLAGPVDVDPGVHTSVDLRLDPGVDIDPAALMDGAVADLEAEIALLDELMISRERNDPTLGSIERWRAARAQELDQLLR